MIRLQLKRLVLLAAPTGCSVLYVPQYESVGDQDHSDEFGRFKILFFSSGTKKNGFYPEENTGRKVTGSFKSKYSSSGKYERGK